MLTYGCDITDVGAESEVTGISCSTGGGQQGTHGEPDLPVRRVTH